MSCGLSGLLPATDLVLVIDIRFQYGGCCAKVLALVVDEVDENRLLYGSATKAKEERLPIQIVPALDLSQVAVLSWRWDGNTRFGAPATS